MARAAEAGVLGTPGSLGAMVSAGSSAARVARACLAAVGLGAAAARAQVPLADSAFARGDYRTARLQYDLVLARDSLDRHALYRLAILDGWDGELARSLQRFARLRAIDPTDGGFMVSHAQVLAWAGRYAEAVALYDSALARHADRADALAGRARTVAWAGDLEAAERLWREALHRHPDHIETLVGLAQTLYWKGRADLADSYLARARTLAPGDPLARETERLVRAVLDPDVSATTDYSADSDDNRLVALEARVSGPLARADRRGTLTVGWKQAGDRSGYGGRSLGAMGTVLLPLAGRTSVRAAAGVRQLAPDSGQARTPFVGLLGVTLRPTRQSGIGITLSRTPMDETALLIDSGFTIDAVDANADLWGPWGTVSLGGGAARLSDGNRRLHALGAVLFDVPFSRGLSVGPFVRVLGWRGSPGGYFAPDRYTVAELRAVFAWQRHRWTVRLVGGGGGQQVERAGAWQTEWHAAATVARSWRAVDEIALVGRLTNAAATSATGAFRYGAFGVRARVSL